MLSPSETLKYWGAGRGLGVVSRSFWVEGAAPKRNASSRCTNQSGKESWISNKIDKSGMVTQDDHKCEGSLGYTRNPYL